VDYRLAPEHPYPAALQDAAAALHWVADHAEELRIDPHALGVGGDSAGGNLAAVLALMSRDGDVPKLCFQALLYPVTDVTCRFPSYARVRSDLPMTSATMRYFIDHYIPRGMDKSDWRVSPLNASTFAGVPQALVLTVAHDPWCDEGLAYARALDKAGVRVSALHYNDQMHGLLSQGRWIPMANTVAHQVFSLVGHALHHNLKTYSKETT